MREPPPAKKGYLVLYFLLRVDGLERLRHETYGIFIFHKILIFLSLCEENMRVLEISKITLRRAYEGTFVFLVSKNRVPAQDGY